MSGSIVWGGIRACGPLDSAGRDFKLSILAARIESSVSQTICAARAGPVVRDENGVGANRFDHHCADCKIVTAGGHCDPIAIFDPVLFGKARMKFCTRLWILIDECSDAPRLRAGQILANHSSSGQI